MKVWRRFLRPVTIGAFLGGALLGAGTVLGATKLGSDIFPDVRRGTFYDAAVGEMSDLGLIRGYENGNFGPDDNVTRGQIAVIMKRFRDQMLGTGSTPPPPTPPAPPPAPPAPPGSSATHGSIRFTIGAFSVDENRGTATITIVRSEGNEGAVSVQYGAAAGTATAGADFDATSGTLNFADGETSKSFTVTILNDTLSENDETITLTLSNATGGAELGSPKTASLIIDDDDGGGSTSSTSSTSTSTSVNGTFNFSASEYHVDEEGGSVTITIVREDGSQGSVQVNYATSDGTAQSPYFYTSTNGTLSFAAGETSKTFTVTITGNNDITGNKTANLTLSSPTGGAVLGTTKTALLTLVDTDTLTFGTGSFKLGSANYDVIESDKKISVVIKRTGGTKGDVTITYETIDGTAKKISDYTETKGTLTFKAGEATKTIVVPILTDSTDEGIEAFTFTIKSPTGGASLASPSSTSIEITG